MAAKIKDPNKGCHVQVTPKNTRKLIAIDKKTHRGVTFEANAAIEKYTPTVKYTDNGK